MIARYDEILKGPLKVAIYKGNINGLVFGLAQALFSCMFCLVFFVGALMIRDYGVTVQGVYTAIYAIMFGAMSAGGNIGFVNAIF